MVRKASDIFSRFTFIFISGNIALCKDGKEVKEVLRR